MDGTATMESTRAATGAAPPLVTVGFLTYNSADTLRRALDSLVAQDYPNFRLVIRDDVSSDESWAICQEYAARHDFIELHRNERNLGACGNLFRLIRDIRGEAFIWCCPDDEWAPNYISTVVGTLLDNPDAAAVVTATTTVHWHGRRDVLRHLGDDDPAALPVLDLLLAMARRRNRSGTPVFYSRFIHGALRAKFVPEIFPENMYIMAIEPFNLMRMAMLGKMIYLDLELFDKHISRDSFYIRHPNDPYTTTSKKPFSLFIGAAAFLWDVFNSPLTPWRHKIKAPLAAACLLYTEYGYRLFPKWQGGQPW